MLCEEVGGPFHPIEPETETGVHFHWGPQDVCNLVQGQQAAVCLIQIQHQSEGKLLYLGVSA